MGQERRLPPPWALPREPVVVHALWATVYVILGVVGFILVDFVPIDIVTRQGIPVAFVAGILLMTGSLLGLYSLNGGRWYVERGAALLLVAGMIFNAATITLFDADVSEKAIRIGYSLVIILVLTIRLYQIRELTLNPYKA